MKKLIILFMAAFLTFTGYSAEAAQFGVYIAPKAGYNLQDKGDAKISGAESSGLSSETSGAFSGGFAIGYDMQYSSMALPLRLEFEAIWRTDTEAKNTWLDAGMNHSATQKIGLTTYFVNAYWDIYNSSPFIPYLTAGLGMASVKQENDFDNYSFNQDESVFAVNAGLGISWLIRGGFMVDMGYKFIYPGEVTQTYQNITSSIRPSTHEFLFALRYTF